MAKKEIKVRMGKVEGAFASYKIPWFNPCCSWRKVLDGSTGNLVHCKCMKWWYFILQDQIYYMEISSDS